MNRLFVLRRLYEPREACEHVFRQVWRSRARILALGLVAVAGGLWPSAAAAQTTPTNNYPYWVASEWQWRLSLPASAADPGKCISRAQRGPVWFLDSNNQSSVTCAIPAGRSIMLDVPSVACTTLDPPPFHATTNAALQRCAQRLWQRYPGGLSVSVDGSALHPPGYLVTTPAFGFTEPARGSLIHTSGRTHGRAAVFGSATILGPLSRGAHTLVVQIAYSNTSVFKQVTFRVTVA